MSESRHSLYIDRRPLTRLGIHQAEIAEDVPVRVFNWKADPGHGGEGFDGRVADRSWVVEGVFDQKRPTMPHNEPAK